MHLCCSDDDAVIDAVEAVLQVAAAGAPFADVVALEVGAGGQDHVGELRLAFHPDATG